jgi:hypothetical protein
MTPEEWFRELKPKPPIPWGEIDKWAETKWGSGKYAKGIKLYLTDGSWNWEESSQGGHN